MTSETKFRVSLTILLVMAFTIVVANILRGEDQPMPVISIQVSPKFVVPNEFKRTTFHIIWRIARHPDNRHWSMVYGCESGESNLSEQSMDGEKEQITWDVFRDIKAGGGCSFEACVYRGAGKPFKCARQFVAAPSKEGER